MARKNVLEVSEPPHADQPAEQPRKSLGRPLMGLERPLKPASPVGAISQSLDAINSRAHRADEIERKLAEGQTVIEIDPGLVDSSIVIDRLGVETEDQAALVAQIREHGQQVPILVRPHPEIGERFQIAYGHRRLAAVREIGTKVRAVVRNLTDEQLVVSQGQENNSRTDLSYIERCYFAAKLEKKGFSREVIMASLGVDKAALSRMIGLANRLPPEIIEAVGPAPSFGRQRWAELADLLEERGNKTKALKFCEKGDFLAAKSDARFEILYNSLKAIRPKPTVTRWTAPNGSRPVKITETALTVTMAFDKRIAPDFASFVQARLEELYAECRSTEIKEQ